MNGPQLGADSARGSSAAPSDLIAPKYRSVAFFQIREVLRIGLDLQETCLFCDLAHCLITFGPFEENSKVPCPVCQSARNKVLTGVLLSLLVIVL